MGIAHLLVMALEKEGVPKAEATRKIWMVDSKGLIVKVLSVWRPEGYLISTAIGLEEISRGKLLRQRREQKEGSVLTPKAKDSSQSSLNCSCPEALNHVLPCTHL